jgi:hypothetical protein
VDIVDWIEGFYNGVRMHTGIGYLAPVEGNSASWLRDLVYVETMQGHLYRSPPALALRE